MIIVYSYNRRNNLLYCGIYWQYNYIHHTPNQLLLFHFILLYTKITIYLVPFEFHRFWYARNYIFLSFISIIFICILLYKLQIFTHLTLIHHDRIIEISLVDHWKIWQSILLTAVLTSPFDINGVIDSISQIICIFLLYVHILKMNLFYIIL